MIIYGDSNFKSSIRNNCLNGELIAYKHKGFWKCMIHKERNNSLNINEEVKKHHGKRGNEFGIL